MSLLGAQITKAYFGDGQWEVTLENDGTLVDARVPSWNVGENRASAKLVFKFAEFTTFDELVVRRDGFVVDAGEKYPGPVSLPPGAEWAHEITVSLGEVGE